MAQSPPASGVDATGNASNSVASVAVHRPGVASSPSAGDSHRLQQPLLIDQAPPVYTATPSPSASTAQPLSGRVGGDAAAYELVPPPAYDERDYKLPSALSAGKLPTYDELESDGRLQPTAAVAPAGASTVPPIAQVNLPPGYRIVSWGFVDGQPATATAAAAADVDPETLLVRDDALLGTDFMFVLAFMLTFMFNWMGFLVVTCVCRNIAARYGALAGFGLSLAKWTLIVKSSTKLGSAENGWLCWLIMIFGFVIFVRSTFQYVSVKRNWPLMTMASAQRMLIFDN